MLKHKSLTALIISCALIFSTSTAFAASKTLSISPIKQEKTNWCWSAASIMHAKFTASQFHSKSVSKTQTEVVVHVKGANVNEGASYAELDHGHEFVEGVAGDDDFYGGDWIYSYEGISDTYIDNNKPLTGIMTNPGVGSHAVVIIGYDDKDWPWETNDIMFNDPWDGTKHMCSYDSFWDGSALSGYAFDGVEQHR